MKIMEHLPEFIARHWAMGLALVIVLILIIINEAMSQKKRAKEVSTAQAIDLINSEEAVVVDLRDPETFRAGHIINATQANPEDFNKPKLEKFKNCPLIIVCAKGIQSSALANKLRDQGYDRPMVLAGGMTAWVGAGLPIVKGK